MAKKDYDGWGVVKDGEIVWYNSQPLIFDEEQPRSKIGLREDEEYKKVKITVVE